VRKILTGQLTAAVAFVLLAIAGTVSGAVIVSHQRINPPSWVPIIGKDEFTLRVQLTSVQGVLPGQGQAVTVSGVRVGQIGSVALVDGAAIASLRIEKRYAHIYPNATVLLRPKTPLKDMVAELDPGTPSSGPQLKSGALLRTNQTAADVNLDEILATLDRDSRDYLNLLLADGAQALSNGGGDDLANVFRRFEPLSRHVGQASRLVAKRRVMLKRLVGNLSQLSQTKPTTCSAASRCCRRRSRSPAGHSRRSTASAAHSARPASSSTPPRRRSGRRCATSSRSSEIPRPSSAIRSARSRLPPSLRPSSCTSRRASCRRRRRS
jgi:uncharacterized membrane protein